MFEAAPNDEKTIQCLVDFHKSHPQVRCFDISINSQVEHKSHPEGARIWSRDRYETMSLFRNNLLGRARVLNPDAYFSLDTDILLEDRTTISHLFSLLGTCDAVNPLLYMMPDNIDFPSVMTWVPDGRAYRANSMYPLGDLFQADVIMAAVMMSPKLYHNVNYTWHVQGEDLGFSTQCRLKGYKLWCASNLYAPHIMSRSMLNEYKLNGDPRKLLYLTQVKARQQHLSDINSSL